MKYGRKHRFFLEMEEDFNFLENGRQPKILIEDKNKISMPFT
jgi:hypothetical protein